jgi:transcriptional regulator with XRE-family HTH domain
LSLYQNSDNQSVARMKDVKNIKELVAIGRKIKSFRTLKGFTQEDLAEQLGISKTSVQDIENGKTDLNFTRLQQIADQLNATLVELIGIGEGDFVYIHKNTGGNQAKVIWNNHSEDSENKLILSEQKVGFLEEKIRLLEQSLKDKNASLQRENENLKEIIALLKSKKES